MSAKPLHRGRGLGWVFSLFLLLTSCSEILYLSTEQMAPPDVMPEKATRSVGIVNNFSQHNVIIINDEALIYPCDPDSVREQVALSFAHAGALDRVVVLDSLLYPTDSITPYILPQEKVNVLCRELEVDMLYSIDYACVITNPAARTIGRPVIAYLCSRAYTPDKDSISGTATMDRKIVESWSFDTAQVRQLMPKVPKMLADVAIEPYFPSWKERERMFYYDRLCYELREAKVYVSEHNWEAAAEQWRTLATSKQRIRRFESAYNMALYYEMTDSIDQAIASLDRAKEIAMKKNKKDETETQVIDTSLVKKYRKALVKRKEEIKKLEQYQLRIP